VEVIQGLTSGKGKNAFGNSARWVVDFINRLPVAVYRTTIEGEIRYGNRALAKIFGFESVADIIGYPVVGLYRNKKDRGVLIHAVMQRGRVIEVPVAFVRKDGSQIWCSVTAQAVLDEDGIVVHLDGILRDITGEIKGTERIPPLDGLISTSNDVVAILDIQGKIQEINAAGAAILGETRKRLRGQLLQEYLVAAQRDLFLLFLSDILKFGSEQVLLTVMGGGGKACHLDVHAIGIKKANRFHHIKIVGQDVTERMNVCKKSNNEEKLQGVLEMAGGVAHRLNQPLTIAANLLGELVQNADREDDGYEKLRMVQNQIGRMTEITQKIGKIKKYAAMEYVAGVKIFDIDRAS
jgi:PAS domain S-box-containing protein